MYYTLHWFNGSKNYVHGVIDDIIKQSSPHKKIDWYADGLVATHRYEPMSLMWLRYEVRKYTEYAFRKVNIDEIAGFLGTTGVIEVSTPSKTTSGIILERKVVLLEEGSDPIECFTLSTRGGVSDVVECFPKHPDFYSTIARALKVRMINPNKVSDYGYPLKDIRLLNITGNK